MLRNFLLDGHEAQYIDFPKRMVVSTRLAQHRDLVLRPVLFARASGPIMGARDSEDSFAPETKQNHVSPSTGVSIVSIG